MRDLHPYDGVTRVFEHTDADPSEGLEIAARLLKLPQGSLVDARYRLSFHSGGSGIIDNLAISIAWREGPAMLDARDDLMNPEEALADPRTQSDFEWLVQDEDAPLPITEAAARFINENRKPFQPACTPSDLWFDTISGVNTWYAFWIAEGRLSFLGFDQG